MSETRAKLMTDIKACNGGISCLKPSVQKNSSTASPIVDGSSKSTRKFDGWSFFGGIIVTIGTTAIAFIGIKYYQARNVISQNYNLM